MRANSLSHGTGVLASLRLRAGSAANSSGLNGGVAGTSRKLHHHNSTQARLSSARAMKEPRHDTHSTSTAIKGGVTALPIRAKEWVMPWAKPQLRSGVHIAIARVAV